MTTDALVAAMNALLGELLLCKLAGDDEALDEGMERLDALYWQSQMRVALGR